MSIAAKIRAGVAALPANIDPPNLATVYLDVLTSSGVAETSTVYLDVLTSGTEPRAAAVYLDVLTTQP